MPLNCGADPPAATAAAAAARKASNVNGEPIKKKLNRRPSTRAILTGHDSDEDDAGVRYIHMLTSTEREPVYLRRAATV